MKELRKVKRFGSGRPEPTRLRPGTRFDSAAKRSRGPIMDASTSYSGSSHRSRRRRRYGVTDREEFLLQVILPAIRGRTCPICLATLENSRAAVIANCLHGYCAGCIRTWSDIKRNCPLCNAEFRSWFFGIDLHRRCFHEERLPPLGDERNRVVGSDGSNSNRRIVRFSQDEVAGASLRTRPLPWRRSFGRPGSVPSALISERKLQWRLSIYNRRLRAVPLSSSQSSQDMPKDRGSRDRKLNKIEPWIRRELDAILGDPDPSIIVHVVTSLFMKDVEKKLDTPSIQVEEDNPAASLRPFLHDKADLFWHELRCFSLSSLSMETYDAVVEYRQFEEV